MISICIVNWNTRDLLRECLRAIAAHPPAEPHEIIVVDNASPDGSAAMVAVEFPQVKLCANSENLLYAKGSNQALAEAVGDFVMLLNPDCEVKAGCLDRLAEFLRADGEAGAAAPRLSWPDGRVQRSCRAFPTPRALLCDIFKMGGICGQAGDYRMRKFGYDVVAEVDQPMASALMIKREAINEIGGFDEGFPMFFNDVDLCLRLRQAGWKIFFVPEAEAVHHHGSATSQRRREMIVSSHDSLMRFYRKHYWGRTGWWGYQAVLFMTRLGKFVRQVRG